jgi:hypothetical protein
MPSDKQQRPVEGCRRLNLPDESFQFAFLVRIKQRTSLGGDEEQESSETGESAYEKR